MNEVNDHLLEKEEKKHSETSGLIKNPYIDDANGEFLFHLGFGTKTHNFRLLFGDIKFVCMGGTVYRMKQFANFIAKEIGYTEAGSSDEELVNLAETGHRYSMFKVGCVLCINHGIGYGSITIVLHEIIKLLHYADVRDAIIFRIGTSGGFSATEGSVVIAEKAVNDYLEEYHQVAILGKDEKFPAILDKNLCNELKTLTENVYDFPILQGTTMSHENFYESVASTKAAICSYNDAEREKFYRLLLEKDVLNADMEITALASITHQLGIRSAVVNVVVNNIVKPSKEVIAPDVLKEWQTRPQKVVAEYIKKHHLRQDLK